MVEKEYWQKNCENFSCCWNQWKNMLLEIQDNKINWYLAQYLKQTYQSNINNSKWMWFTEHYGIYKISFNNNTDKTYDWSHKIDSEHKMINCWFVRDFTESLTVSKESLPTDWNEHKKVTNPHCVRIINKLPSFTGLLLSGNSK